MFGANSRVLHVTTDGTVHIAAGSGNPALGDGGPATSASLSNPTSVVALAGGAYAATNALVGSGGVISGCVPAKGGTLSVVKSGHKCPRGTVSLKFNQRGQPGKHGTSGATGRQGSPRVGPAKARSTSEPGCLLPGGCAAGTAPSSRRASMVQARPY